MILKKLATCRVALILLSLLLAPWCLDNTTAVHAGTVSANLFYDDVNQTVTSFDYTASLTDGATGIEFDVTVTITPNAGGELRTNGGTSDREWGVRTAGDNAAISSVGEFITASLTSLNVTNFNGNDPGDVTVDFDGFTDIILFFTGNDGDAGQLTDGSNTLFSWEGTLDPDGADFGDTSFSGAPYTYGIVGESSVNTNNAQVDLSGSLPTTLVAEYAAHSGTGAPVDPNRWRVDDYGVQFTVTVIPEPATSLLLGSALLVVCYNRRWLS